jgi:hypothetical protein
VQTSPKTARAEKVVEAKQAVMVDVIPTPEVAPTAVYETEILATLPEAEAVTSTPETTVEESTLTTMLQSEATLEAVQVVETVKVVVNDFETAIPVLPEVETVVTNAAEATVELAEDNVPADTVDSEIISNERPAREHRDRRGRTRRSRNGNNERPPRNANNSNEATAFQPAVDLEPLVIELTNSQLVDITPMPVVVVVEPTVAAVEEAVTVEPVATKRNPKMVDQQDNSQANVAQPETQVKATPVLVENTATPVIESDNTLPKAGEAASVTETVLDATPMPEPQAQANEVEAITEPPKPEDNMEVKAIPKKRPIWMHIDPAEADKAEQV